MKKGKLEKVVVVSLANFGSYRRCLNYARRIGSKEIFRPDVILFTTLLTKGYSPPAKLGQSSEFTLLKVESLPSFWQGGIAVPRLLLTLRVLRDLPPFSSVQRYVCGATIAAAEAPPPKRTPRKRKARASVVARRVVVAEG